jgi:hypothetical protein
MAAGSASPTMEVRHPIGKGMQHPVHDTRVPPGVVVE